LIFVMSSHAYLQLILITAIIVTRITQKTTIRGTFVKTKIKFLFNFDLM